MCNEFSMVVHRNGRVYGSESDSHSDVQAKYGLKDTQLGGRRIWVRIEVTEKKGYIVDEITEDLPRWYEDNQNRIRDKCEQIALQIKKEKEVYLAIEKPAREEYEAIKDKAWKEYKAIRDKAWKEYKAIEKPAWGEYEAIRDKAYEEYKAIEKPAYEKYVAIEKPVREVYSTARNRIFESASWT